MLLTPGCWLLNLDTKRVAQSVENWLPHRILNTKSRSAGIPEHETLTRVVEHLEEQNPLSTVEYAGERKNSDQGENSPVRF